MDGWQAFRIAFGATWGVFVAIGTVFAVGDILDAIVRTI